jgi:hypothetical protein
MSQYKSSNIPQTDLGNDPFAVYQVNEIYKPAIRDSLLYQLAKKQPLSGRSMSTPAFEFLNQVDSTTPELSDYPEASLQFTGKEVEAVDCGLTLVITREAMEVAHDKMDLLMAHRDALKEHMTRELEIKCADALRQCQVKSVLASATAITDTVNGTPGAAAAADFNIYLLQLLGTRAKQKWNMKPRENGRYALVANYNALLSIENDASLRNVIQGLGREELKTFYLGSVGNVDIMGSNLEEAVAAQIGAGPVNFSEWYLLGKRALDVGVRRAPSVQFFDDANNKVTEFGKFKYLNYNFAMAFGIPTDSVNKDSVPAIHGSSS